MANAREILSRILVCLILVCSIHNTVYQVIAQDLGLLDFFSNLRMLFIKPGQHVHLEFLNIRNLNGKHPEIGKEIDETKVLNDDLIKRIVDAANKYKTNQYKASV